MRWLPVALLLLCGCSKPLAERLREQGYTNVVPNPGLVCPGDDDLEEGCYAERAGRAWEIAKCCHTTLQLVWCGKSMCMSPLTVCSVHERDLGPLPAEEENATPWPR